MRKNEYYTFELVGITVACFLSTKGGWWVLGSVGIIGAVEILAFYLDSRTNL